MSPVSRPLARRLAVRSLRGLLPAAVVLVAATTGCASRQPPSGTPPAARPAPAAARAEENLRRLVVASARNYVGARRIVLEGRNFGNDCSAYVLGVYAPLGIEPVEPAGGGSRTAMIYRWHEQRGLIFRSRRPAPGDLAFFHDTYDRNGDGRANDRFTHIAVVEKVDRDGTLILLHRGSRQVGRFRMNPSRPGVARDGDRVVNSVLKGTGGAPGAPRLAGQLFVAFGRPVGALLPR